MKEIRTVFSFMTQHHEGASHIPRGARLCYISLFYATRLIVIMRSTHYTTYLHHDSVPTGEKCTSRSGARPRQQEEVDSRW